PATPTEESVTAFKPIRYACFMKMDGTKSSQRPGQSRAADVTIFLRTWLT
ncbi:TPA_asm: hypothetical protein, partial [Porphyromonas phage phage026a_KCOM2802]